MAAQRSAKLDKARGGGRLMSARLITLVTQIRRTAALTYRRELGLSEVDWRVLSQIGEHAPLSLNALAEIIGLDRGQLSRGVTRLVAAGLATRTARRGGPGILIGLSPAGEDLFVRLMALALERNAAFTRGIGAQELATFSAVLDKMTANARVLLESEQAKTRERGRAAADLAAAQA
ncbi:MAG TPA: MarR family transcriptional regulator [Alphaproteobacteria bacterium]|jgi:DNA-binding MarR family transcriptional regulator|nr:MarR family transcriptional regulator [Alphaproteobacteria bacterium]